VAVALKKSDLYGSLWRSCDELRDKQKSDGQSLINVPSGGSFDDMVAEGAS